MVALKGQEEFIRKRKGRKKGAIGREMSKCTGRVARQVPVDGCTVKSLVWERRTWETQLAREAGPDQQAGRSYCTS